MGMLDGLSPTFSTPLRTMMDAARSDGVTLRPVSGYRSEDDQRRAIQSVAQRNNIPFHEGLYATGIPGMAAPVGRSQHQHGSALDWDMSDPAVKSWLYANASRYGFRFPLPTTDSGHMELGGPRPEPTSVPGSYVQPPGSQTMPTEPQRLPGLLGALEQGFSSPMFQMGLGTYNAGASGTNWAGGLLAGQQGYQKTRAEQLTNAQHQMALDQARAGQSYIGGLDPNDPQFKGLPPALISMAKGTQDPSIIAKAYAQKMDLDRAEQMARMQGNIQLQMHIAQKRADLEAELENRKALLEMIGKMRPGGSGATPSSVRRWNPATGELE
jgi:hypothetical protein